MREILKLLIFRFIQLFSFNRIVWHKRNGLYLTFDDGPHENTERILGILKKYSAKATFFLVGKNIEKYEKVAREIIKSGSKIGNHTYSHLKYDGNVKKFISEIKKTDALIKKIYTDYDKSIRIPYGVFSIKLLIVLFLKGYKVYFWNIDFKDGKFVDIDNGLKKINSTNIKDGSIILLHDDTYLIEEYVNVILSRNHDKKFYIL